MEMLEVDKGGMGWRFVVVIAMFCEDTSIFGDKKHIPSERERKRERERERKNTENYLLGTLETLYKLEWLHARRAISHVDTPR